MKTALMSIAMIAALTISVFAGASCTTRKSGTVTITTCTTGNVTTQCRSYQSGNITKTSCS